MGVLQLTVLKRFQNISKYFNKIFIFFNDIIYTLYNLNKATNCEIFDDHNKIDIYNVKLILTNI